MVGTIEGHLKKLILPAIALALVASACSGSTSTDTAEPATTTTAAVATTQAPTTTEATTTTSTVPPTTTTTLSPEAIAQAEYDADSRLIKTLFRRFSDSWSGGLSGGLEDAATYEASNVYPDLLCTYESIMELNSDLPDGYRVEYIVDGDSIERDDGWTMPIGPSKGEPIDGRLYILTLETTYSSTDFLPSVERAEVHATVVDGEAYFFFACWPDENNE